MIELRTDLKKIKDNTSLFNDYLYNYKRVSSFFQWDPVKELSQCMDKRRSAYQHRKNVSQVLLRQSEGWKASPQTIDNIEKFSDEKTLAVVTGQQAGIFGGPLYTVYKILHCIKLASHLETVYSDYHFVPIFWMEVGDSDYKEVNHINFLNLQNELVRLSLPENPEDGRSIYLRDIPSDIEELLINAEQFFPPNEFRDEHLGDLKKIYSSGKSFSDAFAEWVHYLFRDFGLIIIDPTDKEFADLSVPLFKKAITNHKVIQDSIQANARDLQKAGYVPQVNLNAQQSLLFYRLENDNRARIDFEGQNFIIHSTSSNESFSKEALLNEIDKASSRFTPNVLFRPLVQDWLLPTAAYIGGPGEISYAAQLKKIYEIIGIVPPCFIPRMRLTLLEEKIQKAIDKLQIDVMDIFFTSDKIIDIHVKKHSDPRIEDTLKEIHQNIEEKMDKLGKLLIETDPTLQSLVSKTSQNISDLLHRLKNKASSASERKIQTEINQINKIQMNLQPNKIAQERVLNIYQYLFKYGPGLITGLYNTVNIETMDHQIIYF